jgi:hypothetical protein
MVVERSNITVILIQKNKMQFEFESLIYYYNY